jgi:hypothetical protein
VADQVRKGIPEIRVLITLGQKLREGFDRDERVLDFVRHAGGKRADAGEPVAPADLQLEAFQHRDVCEHHKRSEHLALLPMEDGTAGADDRVMIAGGKN